MHTTGTSGWDWWSEVKLAILADYLAAFTKACSGRSPEVLCLDLFAGSFDNTRRHGPGSFPGSTRLALETHPPFTRLAFFELPEVAAQLEADIRAARRGTSVGDVRGRLQRPHRRSSEWLSPVRWAPTFAFLDPGSVV